MARTGKSSKGYRPSRAKHPGFKSVQRSIARRSGVGMKRAGAILAGRTRSASPYAKRKNPRLRRVR